MIEFRFPLERGTGLCGNEDGQSIGSDFADVKN
jgi:hypothetical protein